MKKIFIFLLTTVVTLSFVAYAGVQTSKIKSPIVENSDINNIYISIEDEDSGYYSIRSKGEVNYDKKYNKYEIYLSDSTLLAFEISESRYPGGIGTMSGEEVNAMISSIEMFLNENSVDENTNTFLETILQQIKNISIIEGTST